MVTIEPRLEVIETNPQFTQIVPPNDMVVIVTLQTKIGQTEGLINICIPYLVLEPIMSKLTTTFWVSSASTRQSLPEHINTLQRKLERTFIPMIVELGGSTITVQELLGLNVGDVLQLDTKIEEDLLLRIGQREKFKCKPGLAGSKVAIQITEKLVEGDDNDE